MGIIGVLYKYYFNLLIRTGMYFYVFPSFFRPGNKKSMKVSRDRSNGVQTQKSGGLDSSPQKKVFNKESSSAALWRSGQKPRISGHWKNSEKASWWRRRRWWWRRRRWVMQLFIMPLIPRPLAVMCLHCPYGPATSSGLLKTWHFRKNVPILVFSILFGFCDGKMWCLLCDCYKFFVKISSYILTFSGEMLRSIGGLSVNNAYVKERELERSSFHHAHLKSTGKPSQLPTWTHYYT